MLCEPSNVCHTGKVFDAQVSNTYCYQFVVILYLVINWNKKFQHLIFQWLFKMLLQNFVSVYTVQDEILASSKFWRWAILDEIANI